jgi:hypothetical protein
MSSYLDEQVEKLCREIPEEKDSDKMMKLVQQLNELLEAKESAARHPHLIADNAQPSATESTPAQRERQSA